MLVWFLARITVCAYGPRMSEHEDVLEDLQGHGVLAGIAWAVAASRRRLLQDAEGEPAYGQTWIGQTAHSLMCDRLDRVFACAGYAHAAGQAEVGLDVLHAGLTAEEVRAMPTITPGLVVRNGLNGSPGWRCGQWRWLMSSYLPRAVEDIRWSVKRPTKQHVAQQGYKAASIPHEVLALFEVEAAAFQPPGDGITTLVLAHAFDVQEASSEAYLGRSQYNPEGESPWYWKEPITESTRTMIIGGRDDSRLALVSDDEADAPVRLRQTRLREGDAATSTDKE